jgi:hypothetical protein
MRHAVTALWDFVRAARIATAVGGFDLSMRLMTCMARLEKV